MKLNKKLAGIIAGTLCLITIGGIAAYLTSTKTLRNTITVGHNEIDIIETFEPPAALIPGTTFRKEVSVKNTGPVPCYVRVTIIPNDDISLLKEKDVASEILRPYAASAPHELFADFFRAYLTGTEEERETLRTNLPATYEILAELIRTNWALPSNQTAATAA